MVVNWICVLEFNFLNMCSVFPLYGFLFYLSLGIFKATILVLTSNSSYESNGPLHLNDELFLTVSHSLKFFLPVTPKGVPIF